MCGSIWGEKQFLLIIVLFYCFEQKGLFTTNPNFPLDFPLFKLVEKNKLSLYFWASFWASHFLEKSVVYSELAPKYFKTTEKHSLAVCVILRRNFFFVNICPVLLLWIKGVIYNKSKFSSGFAPFQTCWEKYFLSISALLSEIVIFWTKKRSFMWISPKTLQNNRKA